MKCNICKLECNVLEDGTCGDCLGIADAHTFYASEDAVLTLVID